MTYYPYVIVMPHSGFVGYFEMGVFHIFIVFLFASYIQTAVIDPGTVPLSWHTAVLSSSEATQNRFKKCRRSGLFKPPRSHYDSVTERVVLNMDHFCPWVMNTVGFYNRKFFVLFLVYTFCACLWYVGAILVRFIAGTSSITNLTTSTVLGFVAFILDSALVLTLACFATFHVFMVVNNETTIDGSSLPQYNVGWRQNTEQVMGANPWLWLLPVYGSGPVGDGINWPTSDTHDSKALLRRDSASDDMNVV
eukprot:c7014_g1_i2.p1 GENE.c7014_g1_i2~~c7014_g1_i2.p1  ORF type:complete len:250 (+),score=48.37 c7014_g1_i2:212-961(+)